MYNVYAQVILNNNSKSTDGLFTYGIPAELEDKIEAGKRVKVHFGNSRHIIDALIVSVGNECCLDITRVKPIIDIIDDEPIIRKEMIELALWMRERYICKYSDAIRLMIPSAIKYEHRIIIRAVEDEFKEASLASGEKELFDLIKKGPIEIDMLKKQYMEQDFYKLIEVLKGKNLIEIENRDTKEKKRSYEKLISLINPESEVDSYDINGTENQLSIIDYLKQNGKTNIKKVLNETSVSSSVINNLIKKKIVVCEEVLYEKVSDESETSRVTLNEEQTKAFEKIISSDKKAFLIHGVTGSGKTEVYMSLIEEYQKQNKQSIMLVPEISLTAQTIDRLKARFGNRTAVFHSRLTKKEKLIEWNRVYNREATVIVGARSALFAPIRDMGIIIIDEEHEDSYKSSTSPKYDAVETAIKMAYFFSTKAVMGTATPSVGTYNMAMKKQIELVELNKRAKNAAMPDIAIVDMAGELDKGNNTIISENLYRSMRESLRKKEQIILFINKRGYSGFVSCKKCGYVVRCDRCDVSMTYHAEGNVLRCHYCGRTKKIFDKCPKCGSEKIEQYGAGTQHAEKLINHLFPDAVTERMDFDSMSGAGNYEKIYRSFRDGEIDILIGTQMLAKGFDFPNVTTVGVLSADAILNLPFYNSSEKTFQLITQVSGRAGRGMKKGNVFIQTYEPQNFIINAARDNDYDLFVREELKLRKEFAFPPFINIINICIISKNEELAAKTANEKYSRLKSLAKDLADERKILLYRPVPHSIYKVNDEYRINLFIKASNNSMGELRKIIRTVYMEEDIENIKISININTDTI